MNKLNETTADTLNLPLSADGEAFRDKNPAKYMQILNLLDKTRTDKIFSYILNVSTFPVVVDDDDYDSFLSEMFRQVLKVRHKWTDADLSSALERYTSSLKPLYDRPRIKKCYNCEADLTESFAVLLTADALITGESIMVTCPHCGSYNFIKAEIPIGG